MKARDIIFTITAIILSSLLSVSCVEEIETSSIKGEGLIVSMNLDVQTEKPLSRSNLGSDLELDKYENKITDITIFQVEECISGKPIVAATYYYNIANGQTPQIKGLQGRAYVLYCLVNCNDMSSKVVVGDPLQSVLDLKIIELPGDKQGNKLERGLMRSVIISLKQGLKNNETLTIHPVPIYARIDVKIIKDFKNGNFKLTDLQILNDNWVQYPFIVENPQMLYDGKIFRTLPSDLSTNDDLVKLENGESVRYYASEYIVGKLIDNPEKDPWKKIPNETINKTKPSYIEISGNFIDKTGMFTASAKYKMYLGENAYDNFDIKAGYQYALTITLTDREGFNNSSWKIETINSNDKRIFDFTEPNYCFIDFNVDDYTIPVSTNMNKDQMFYTFYTAMGKPKPWTPEEMGLIFDNKTLSVMQDKRLYDCELPRVATLYASSWDGRIIDSTRVIASEAYKAPYITVDYCDFPPTGGNRRELSMQIGYRNLSINEYEQIVAKPYDDYTEIKNAYFWNGSSRYEISNIQKDQNGKIIMSVPSNTPVDDYNRAYFQFTISNTPLGYSHPIDYYYRVYFYTKKVSCQNPMAINYNPLTKNYYIGVEGHINPNYYYDIISDNRYIKFTNVTNPRLGNRIRLGDSFKAILTSFNPPKSYSRVYLYDCVGGFIANFENSVNKKQDIGGERYYFNKEFGINLKECRYSENITFEDSTGVQSYLRGYLLEFYPYKGMPCEYVKSLFGAENIKYNVNTKFYARNNNGFSEEMTYNKENGDARFFRFEVNKPAILFQTPPWWPDPNSLNRITYYRWEITIDYDNQRKKLIIENNNDLINWSLESI